MNKQIVFPCVAVAVIVVIGAISLTSATNAGSAISIVTNTSSALTITYNPHPCGLVATDVNGWAQLQLEADTQGRVNSSMCIHSILTNIGNSTIDLGSTMMTIKVEDAHGKSVYNAYCVVLEQPAPLATGKTWDCTGYWTPSSIGTYSLNVSVDPVSASVLIFIS